MAQRLHSKYKCRQTVANCGKTIAQQWHSGCTAIALQVQKQTNCCKLQLNNCTAMAQQWLSDGTAVANAVKQ